MNKLHELGTGWIIKGGVATRGNVSVAEWYNPTIYRASFGDFTASDYESPLVALASLRGVLVRHMQSAEKALDDMAEALAAIDAPAPPEERDEFCCPICNEMVVEEEQYGWFVDGVMGIVCDSCGEPPDSEICECKTAVTLATKNTARGVCDLMNCEWGCERVWLAFLPVGDIVTKELSLNEAGCLKAYWPEFCNNNHVDMMAWFYNEFEVTE